MATSSCTANTTSNSDENRISDEHLRIVMVGKTGAGKSATGNTILGRKFFESKLSAKSLTVDCSKGRAVVDGQKVAVIDTPGLFDTRFDKDETDQHLSQCITFAAPGPHVFLVVISLVDRNREKESQIVQKIQELYGESADKYSMVLFTHGDQLEETTIEEFLDGCPDLKKLVARCDGQYHVFNNKVKERSQVIELLQKIKEICKKNTGSYYTNEIFQEARRAVEEKTQQIPRENEEQSCGFISENLNTDMSSSLCTSDTDSDSDENRTNDECLRIVLVGKTGAGKSATGNTILGRKYFESKLSATSMTVDCSKGRAEVDGQKVAVIDTPGLFDTSSNGDEKEQESVQLISFAAPGPHVFLVVISLVDRFTEDEEQTVLMAQDLFDVEANKYSMVLFTHGDQLENTTIEEFLDGSPDLQELVARCDGQYHVFNNKELEERSQVIELLQKIREICKKNTGSYYTNSTFQDAERTVEKRKKSILRENKEQRRREKGALERKYEERLREEMKKLDEKLQIEREKQRKEGEEQRRMEMQGTYNELQQEREEREAEMRRVREEKESEIENMKMQLVEAHDRELREEREKLQERHKNLAREKAEKTIPFIIRCSVL